MHMTIKIEIKKPKYVNETLKATKYQKVND